MMLPFPDIEVQEHLYVGLSPNTKYGRHAHAFTAWVPYPSRSASIYFPRAAHTAWSSDSKSQETMREGHL